MVTMKMLMMIMKIIMIMMTMTMTMTMIMMMMMIGLEVLGGDNNNDNDNDHDDYRLGGPGWCVSVARCVAPTVAPMTKPAQAANITVIIIFIIEIDFLGTS